MPNPPYVPQLVNTGNFEKDTRDNLGIIVGYLQYLTIWLAEGEPDPGWSVNGIIENRALTAVSSPTQVLDFVGTLALVLTQKGILGGVP